MPIYEYQGQHYDIAETDPAAAKQKILDHLGKASPVVAKDKPVEKKAEEQTNHGAQLASTIASGLDIAAGAVPAAAGVVTSILASPYEVVKDAIFGKKEGEADPFERARATGAKVAQFGSGGVPMSDTFKGLTQKAGLYDEQAYQGEALRSVMGLAGSAVGATSEFIANKTGMPQAMVQTTLEGLLLKGPPKISGSILGAIDKSLDIAKDPKSAMDATVAAARVFLPYWKGKTLSAIYNTFRDTGARAEAEEATRAQGIRKALEQMGGAMGSASIVGETMQQGAHEDLAAANDRAQRAHDLQLRKMQGKLTASQEAENKARSAETSKKEGLGEPVPVHDLGSTMQEDVIKQQEPILSARSNTYDAMYNDAIKSGEERAKAERPWQATPEGKAVREKWQKEIKAGRLTKEAEAEVNRILDDIYDGSGNKPITNEWGEEVGKTAAAPKSIKAIDDYARLLADKGYLDAEGGKAIGTARARELRKDLIEGVAGKDGKRSGGVYDWEPKLKEAKDFYKEKSGDLAAYRTKEGKATTGVESDFTGRTELDPTKVPKKYFSTQRSFQALSDMVGPQNAKTYARQNAINDLHGLDSKHVSTWLGKDANQWIEAVPGLRGELEKYQQSLEQAEKTTGKRKNISEERASQLQDAKKKGWSSSVDDFAKEQIKMVGEPGKRPVDVLGDVLGSKYSPVQFKALGEHIKNNPEAMKALPDAIRYILSKKAPGSIGTHFNELRPTLEQSGLLSKEDLNTIGRDVDAIVKATKEDKSIPFKQKSKIISNKIVDRMLMFGVIQQGQQQQ